MGTRGHIIMLDDSCNVVCGLYTGLDSGTGEDGKAHDIYRFFSRRNRNLGPLLDTSLNSCGRMPWASTQFVAWLYNEMRERYGENVGNPCCLFRPGVTRVTDGGKELAEILRESMIAFLYVLRENEDMTFSIDCWQPVEKKKCLYSGPVEGLAQRFRWRDRETLADKADKQAYERYVLLKAAEKFSAQEMRNVLCASFEDKNLLSPFIASSLDLPGFEEWKEMLEKNGKPLDVNPVRTIMRGSIEDNALFRILEKNDCETLAGFYAKWRETNGVSFEEWYGEAVDPEIFRGIRQSAPKPAKMRM